MASRTLPNYLMTQNPWASMPKAVLNLLRLLELFGTLVSCASHGRISPQIAAPDATLAQPARPPPYPIRWLPADPPGQARFHRAPPVREYDRQDGPPLASADRSRRRIDTPGGGSPVPSPACRLGIPALSVEQRSAAVACPPAGRSFAALC